MGFKFINKGLINRMLNVNMGVVSVDFILGIKIIKYSGVDSLVNVGIFEYYKWWFIVKFYCYVF